MESAKAIINFCSTYTATKLNEDPCACYKALGYLEALEFFDLDERDRKFIDSAKEIVNGWLSYHMIEAIKLLNK